MKPTPTFLRRDVALSFRSDTYLPKEARAVVEVRCYLKASSMRRAIGFRNQGLGVGEDVSDVVAMFSPERSIGFDGKGFAKFDRDERLGLLWLHGEALGAGVVTHECLHVACEWMRRLPGHRRGLSLKDYCGNEEELLAHLLTVSVRSVYALLRDEGLVGG